MVTRVDGSGAIADFAALNSSSIAVDANNNLFIASPVYPGGGIFEVSPAGVMTLVGNAAARIALDHGLYYFLSGADISGRWIHAHRGCSRERKLC